MSSDRFASYDAAYVLGALSPRDRQEFEQHLRECQDCRQAVGELAGMPGLLSKVPPDLVTEAPADGLPDTLQPRLLRRVRTQRRRTRVTAIGASVLAAAACVVLAVVLAVRPFEQEPLPQAIPSATMSPVRSAPVFARVGLEDVAWGTKVNMQCAYQKGGTIYGDGKYYLVVISAAGEVDRIGSWTARPGKDAKLQGATSWTISEIATLEIRTSSGQAVLRLQV